MATQRRASPKGALRNNTWSSSETSQRIWQRHSSDSAIKPRQVGRQLDGIRFKTWPC
jgi:hypothetical protein